ncbi:16016_t:CDS:2 [Gigaspora margarita]|uniref:16016_t:CDS:1 n=1 Tax=Gigaspora margarita TaxID=4874 RepID=A0ABN7UUY4_GIGMA|nr:16016_t:CDS:2 [Gigaspora margarita]
MKCNGKMIMTRVNADMYGNTDDIDSVRGTILKTKNDGMNNVGCFYQRGTKVSIWSLKGSIGVTWIRLSQNHEPDP